jgi:hypothetical protein
MNEHTLINNLKNIDIKEKLFSLEKDASLSKIIMNLDVEHNIRVKALEEYYLENKEDAIDIINRMTGMYQFSGTNNIFKFLYYICNNTSLNISVFLKFECAKSLLSFQEIFEENETTDDDEIREIKKENNLIIKKRNEERLKKGYISLNNVYKEMYKNNNISTILKVEAINLLSNCVDYVDDINEYIKDIISNINLDIEFRYKLILSIENFNLEKDIKMKLINDNLIIILNHKENNIMYRILAGQYLLQNKTNINESSELLYDICVDDTIDFNLRADAADILLSLSTDEYKTKAINIIKYLGTSNKFGGGNKGIYDNSQNVHIDSIDKSVYKIIEFIASKNKTNKTIENISKLLLNFCDNDILKDKVNVSIQRIVLDRKLYINNTLLDIFLKLYEYIDNHEYKDELINRLVEELIDMAHTCSSGFVSRLVNTLSGFTEHCISISYTEQLISNFIGRMNYHLKNIKQSKSIFLKDEFLWSKLTELYTVNDNKINKIKNMINELDSIRGDDIYMISLIIPYDKTDNTITIINDMLINSYQLTTTIKDKNNKMNTIDTIDYVRKILKTLSNIPLNGLIIYCGNLNSYINKKEIYIDFEPDIPIKDDELLYKFDNKFYTDILHNFLQQKINKYKLENINDDNKNNILDYFEEQILNEISLENYKYEKKYYYLLFFRTYMLKIREELYEEFKDYMSDTEFDLCIRNAISTYEGCDFFL